MISKKILVPAFIVAAIGAGAVFKVSLIEAVTNNPQNGLVTYLSQKLGIDQSKVQLAVDGYRDQQRADRQKQMTANYSTYLSGLVKEGKLTESQKSALLSKHEEIQKSHQSDGWSTKTPQERFTQMQKDRTDLEAWAKSQGIDVTYLRFGFGGRGEGRGMGRGGMMRAVQF